MRTLKHNYKECTIGAHASIEVLFKVDTTDTINPILDGHPFNKIMGLKINESGQVLCIVNNELGLTPHQIATSDKTIRPNRWYHLVCVRTSNNIKIYINGKLNKGLDLNHDYPWISGEWNIGANITPGASIKFKGNISRFRIFNLHLF